MNPLKEHERWEMETLDLLRRARFLEKIIFGGGTMLRLCHQLPRYSVDLDFYLRDPDKPFAHDFYSLCKIFEKEGLEITDKRAKHFTYLIELRRLKSQRRLKLEIRKDNKQAGLVELAIAFSPDVPNLQVRLHACTLRQMWINKVESLLDRKLIRDAYDIEFLLRRGAGSLNELNIDQIQRILKIVKGFKKSDFLSVLSPLLTAEEKRRVMSSGFALLEGELRAFLNVNVRKMLPLQRIRRRH